MSIPTNPRVRPLEMMPHGDPAEGHYVLRDPHGLAGTVVLPPYAAILVSLMNGQRTLGDIRTEFQQTVGQSIPLIEIENFVAQLDENHFLDSESFAAFQQAQLADYLALPVRPAAHAGGAYHGDPDGLRQQLSDLFTCEGGPGLLPWEGNVNGENGTFSQSKLCGVMSPHIDFHRGGPAFAWAYDRIVTESQAKLFVILGTAHTPLQSFYSVSRKDYETPLGTVPTDRKFIDALAIQLGKNYSGVFQDELPHRHEHSIEFQTLMLQFILGGRRDFRVVPILVGSFHPFVEHGRMPDESPVVAEFIDGLRESIRTYGEEVCVVAGVDMAHIGQQFGDEELLAEERLKDQWTDDQQLLAKACVGDADAWFMHVAKQEDANRICGLAPMYTMLKTIEPERGELLKYDQAVAPDGTSCVSFAAAAFYE
ncbi:AmmeMemoRadiSam system protein B [Bythopirellula polymerisocia]|uniref:AmmeMemoRadiSam system protein B n=1 Tax=Bythopirellula polymerisocia TaxID=2528003 RepID=A0A5C6CYN9_9BACT|nr:AmmeMemoRadiSam system protein B [Bythopirellula polymerisocia]TWU28591.1 hypothetical protein Pla144_18820 [Bythopirellula polymerisocia]